MHPTPASQAAQRERLLKAGGSARRPEPSSVSLELSERATQRLAFISGASMVLLALSSLLVLLAQPNIGPRMGTTRPLVLIPVGFVVSLVFFLVARSRRLRAATILHAGLAYLVILCFLIAVFGHWLPYSPSDVVRGPSPVTLPILLFAVMVPSPPKRMSLALILAGLSDPLALSLTVWLGNPSPPWNLWLWLSVPGVLTVVLAIIMAHMFNSLQRQATLAQKLGSYELIEKLGGGGMGEVWRARHHTLVRPAAIKLIKPEALGQASLGRRRQLRMRFEREAQATAALQSPHTIAIYDYGVAEDGSFYYVMELLAGLDLDTLVRRHGPVSPARAVHFLLQALHSLREAHAAGLVHRDIKPANLMACRRAADLDVVKVLDFGLVKLAGGETEAPAAEELAASARALGIAPIKLTADGAFTGTPAFMSPESLGGQTDPRSDLYSLGCVAYWLLSGSLVFPRDTAIAVMAAQLKDDPLPLREAAAQPVPEALDRLVLRCLAKSVHERPQSAEELAQALRETGLAEAWTAADAGAWWAEHPLAAPEAIVAEDELATQPDVQTRM